MDTLENVALRCYWSNPDERTRQRMTTVAEALPVAGLVSSLITAGLVAITWKFSPRRE